ncbi:hypothetical protein GCM10023238_26630 [Streptomyces heliomycini]
MRQRVPDGVWLAELAPVDDPDAVPEAVLTAVGARETVLYGAAPRACGPSPTATTTPVERLAEHCGPRRMLLILDNCEHVALAAARLVEALLERCPRLTVLATSREPLGVRGELLRPVEPLPEPVALRLLAERGAAARSGFRTDADDDTAAACAEICRRLDGLPLAIELAAARLRMLTPRPDRRPARRPLPAASLSAAAPSCPDSRPCGPSSTGPGTCSTRTNATYWAGCRSSRAAATSPPPRPSADRPRSTRSAPSSTSPSWWPPLRATARCATWLLETVAEYAGERLDESGRRPRGGAGRT